MKKSTRDRPDGAGASLRYFSLRTPLKGFGLDLTSMKRPVSVFRFTQLPDGVCVCDRRRTAPLRWPSPVGLFVATCTPCPDDPGRLRPRFR